MTLTDWITHISQLHPKTVEMGLERIKQVADKLALTSLPCPVIMIGGTNGKGSTVACLEAVYLQNGYDVFASTSPTLFVYNERLRINGKNASDEGFCEAFAVIEKQRGNTPLTFFEMSMLAIFYIIRKQVTKKSVALLEVGLGGRLDATNIVEKDLTIVTSIDLDHQDYLGDTREKIALEKAGIFQSQKPALCGDPNPPHTLLEYAKNHKVPLYRLGIDYHYTDHTTHWVFQHKELILTMTRPLLYGDNVATSIMALLLMNPLLPVTTDSITTILPTVTVPGRFERRNNFIFDVAHNPAAIALLAKKLQTNPCRGKRYAIFSMLADKDIENSLPPMLSLIDEWHIAPIIDVRAATTHRLTSALQMHQVTPIIHGNLSEAYTAVKKQLTPKDDCVVFGSFHTVSAVMGLC